MKTLKRLTIFLSILMLLESCVATRPQRLHNKPTSIDCPNPKYSKREKRGGLLLLLVIIPAVIWVFTPKPLK